MRHLEMPKNMNIEVSMCLLKKKTGLAYSQIDQEYDSDPSGGVKAVQNLSSFEIWRRPRPPG